MSDEARTHGYVIRWREHPDNPWNYLLRGELSLLANGNSTTVMTLREAGKFMSATPTGGEIVRVRRVAGGSTLRDATEDEAREWGWRFADESMKQARLFLGGDADYKLVRVVHGKPRWEIDQEDDNG